MVNVYWLLFIGYWLLFAACPGKFSCLARAIFFPARRANSVSQLDNANVEHFYCGLRIKIEKLKN
jgi:spore maturation protein SpmA